MLPALDQQHREIGVFEHPQRLFDAQHPQIAGVIDARSVGHDHWADGQDFHRLRHGVGRRAGDVGDNRQPLVGERIDHAGLARVAPAEYRDVHPLGGGSLVEITCHVPIITPYGAKCTGESSKGLIAKTRKQEIQKEKVKGREAESGGQRAKPPPVLAKPPPVLAKPPPVSFRAESRNLLFLPFRAKETT